MEGMRKKEHIIIKKRSIFVCIDKTNAKQSVKW